MPSGTSGTGLTARSRAGTCNLQEPFRRTAIGFDTQDLELDVWIPAGGAWQLKDDELLEERIADGRLTAEQVVGVRRLGAEIGAMLDRDEQWWDPCWAGFSNRSTSWRAPSFPNGWEHAPVPP